jgi:hypothetical protein
MVQPITDLSIKASSFGGELFLSWNLPSGLPIHPKIFLFKRSKIDISQNEIDEYFTKLSTNSLNTFNYNGLFVLDYEEKPFSKFSDLVVQNGETYYYKIVIRDQENQEYSEAISANAKPMPLLKVNVKDGKQIVDKAIKKVLDNVFVNPTEKVLLGRDISTIFHFAVEPPAQNYIMIERVNGSTQYRSWADNYAKIQGGQVKAVYDVDVIRATFCTQDTPARRDQVANIFRANKLVLRKFCKALGAVDAEINIEGDYFNPQIHGVNVVGFTIIFSLLMDIKTLIPQEKIDLIIEELKIEEKK